MWEANPRNTNQVWFWLLYLEAFTQTFHLGQPLFCKRRTLGIFPFQVSEHFQWILAIWDAQRLSPIPLLSAHFKAPLFMSARDRCQASLLHSHYWHSCHLFLYLHSHSGDSVQFFYTRHKRFDWRGCSFSMWTGTYFTGNHFNEQKKMLARILPNIMWGEKKFKKKKRAFLKFQCWGSDACIQGAGQWWDLGSAFLWKNGHWVVRQSVS